MRRELIQFLCISCTLLGGCDNDAKPPGTQSSTTQPATFFDFYAANLRTSLFSGCLTLGSFLLTVNTFLIVNLKKEVYDHEEYKKIVEGHRKFKPDYPYYKPLRNLSRLLFVTISLAFFSAALQLTLGTLWSRPISAMICVAAAAAVGVSVSIALCMLACAMRDWFKFHDKVTASGTEKKT